MKERPDEEIVRVATAPNPTLAHIWEEALKDEDIGCKVVGDYLDVAYGDIPGMRAEVWVHKEDAVRASEIIQKLEQSAQQDDTEA